MDEVKQSHKSPPQKAWGTIKMGVEDGREGRVRVHQHHRQREHLRQRRPLAERDASVIESKSSGHEVEIVIKDLDATQQDFVDGGGRGGGGEGAKLAPLDWQEDGVQWRVSSKSAAISQSRGGVVITYNEDAEARSNERVWNMPVRTEKLFSPPRGRGGAEEEEDDEDEDEDANENENENESENENNDSDSLNNRSHSEELPENPELKGTGIAFMTVASAGSSDAGASTTPPRPSGGDQAERKPPLLQRDALTNDRSLNLLLDRADELRATLARFRGECNSVFGTAGVDAMLQRMERSAGEDGFVGIGGGIGAGVAITGRRVAEDAGGEGGLVGFAAKEGSDELWDLCSFMEGQSGRGGGSGGGGGHGHGHGDGSTQGAGAGARAGPASGAGPAHHADEWEAVLKVHRCFALTGEIGRLEALITERLGEGEVGREAHK